MRTERDPTDNVSRVKLLPLRVVLAALPIAVVALPLLWWFGYPPEGWPFVAAVLTLSMIGSGALVREVTGLLSRWLERRARPVATKFGVDQVEFEDQPAGVRRFSLTVVVAYALAGGATSWGITLYVLVFAVERVAAPPLWSHLQTVAVGLGLVGVFGVAIIMGGLALCLALFERAPRDIPRAFRLYRGWIRVVNGVGRSRGVFGQV